MRKLSISATLALVLPLIINALESKTIINGCTGVFYTINLTQFADWPGIGGTMPIDFSAASDRIWIIWPHTIISLDSLGMPDAASLLSIFSSQTADWNGRSWNPENGTVSSKGDWLAYLEGKFYRLDLLTAKLWSIDWKGNPVESIFAAPSGNLVLSSNRKAYHVNFSDEIRASMLSFDIPSILAVSNKTTKLAWLDTSGIHLFSIEDESEEIIPLTRGVLPALGPWGISWFKGQLVLAYPGALYAVNLSVGESSRISKFEARWLPGRWYRLRGNEDALLIHTLETEELRVYRAEEETPIAKVPVYSDFLAEYAITAGKLLEEKEELEAAVQYYNWTLPQIRYFRSRYPLKTVWAKLEHELVERRQVLLKIIYK